MRTKLTIAAVALIGLGCSDSSPTSPLVGELPDPAAARVAFRGASYRSFTLAMAAAEDSPSEAWGVFLVRAGLAPPSPCSPFSRRHLRALTVCAVVYNPTQERLDAVTLEVSEAGVDRPTVFRGSVSAPPNPCNVAILRGVFPAEMGVVTSVTAVLETDQGTVVSGGPGWPGALPAPPNPCALTVTPG